MTRRFVFFGTILLVLSGCISSGPPTKPNDREWNLLLSEYQRIDTLRNTAAKAPADAPRAAHIQALLETHKKLESTYTAFLEKLKEYYERTGDTRAATLYSNEKVRLGDEYMYVLSRYDRALALYDSALALDPANVVARARRDEADGKRFVSMDAFSSVKTSMSEREVQRIVGVPREDWIRQVVQRGRAYAVWIYPKIDGGAAAIYFDNGVVYHTNWNAAPPPAPAP